MSGPRRSDMIISAIVVGTSGALFLLNKPEWAIIALGAWFGAFAFRRD